LSIELRAALQRQVVQKAVIEVLLLAERSLALDAVVAKSIQVTAGAVMVPNAT
jgi:hypothetical protein